MAVEASSRTTKQESEGDGARSAYSPGASAVSHQNSEPPWLRRSGWLYVLWLVSIASWILVIAQTSGLLRENVRWQLNSVPQNTEQPLDESRGDRQTNGDIATTVNRKYVAHERQRRSDVSALLLSFIVAGCASCSLVLDYSARARQADAFAKQTLDRLHFEATEHLATVQKLNQKLQESNQQHLLALQHFHGVLEDRELARQAAEKVTSELRILHNACSELGVLAFSEDSNLKSVNAGARRLLGFADGESLEKFSISQFLFDRNGKAFTMPSDRSKPQLQQLKIVSRSGVASEVLAYWGSHSQAEPNSKQVLVVLDITRQTQMESDLEIVFEQLPACALVFEDDHCVTFNSLARNLLGLETNTTSLANCFQNTAPQNPSKLECLFQHALAELQLHHESSFEWTDERKNYLGRVWKCNLKQIHTVSEKNRILLLATLSDMPSVEASNSSSSSEELFALLRLYREPIRTLQFCLEEDRTKGWHENEFGENLHARVEHLANLSERFSDLAHSTGYSRREQVFHPRSVIEALFKNNFPNLRYEVATHATVSVPKDAWLACLRSIIQLLQPHTSEQNGISIQFNQDDLWETMTCMVEPSAERAPVNDGPTKLPFHQDLATIDLKILERAAGSFNASVKLSSVEDRVAQITLQWPNARLRLRSVEMRFPSQRETQNEKLAGRKAG